MEVNETSAPEGFAVLGLPVAYIKAVIVNGGRAYAIHAADGTALAIVKDRDVAFAAVRQHELEPVSVH